MASYFQISQNVSFWFNAKLDQVDPNIIKITIPFGIIGIVLALLISKSITILSLGEEVSINLGRRTKLVKAMAILSVIFFNRNGSCFSGESWFCRFNYSAHYSLYNWGRL